MSHGLHLRLTVRALIAIPDKGVMSMSQGTPLTMTGLLVTWNTLTANTEKVFFMNEYLLQGRIRDREGRRMLKFQKPVEGYHF